MDKFNRMHMCTHKHTQLDAPPSFSTGIFPVCSRFLCVLIDALHKRFLHRKKKKRRGIKREAGEVKVQAISVYVFVCVRERERARGGSRGKSDSIASGGA